MTGRTRVRLCGMMLAAAVRGLVMSEVRCSDPGSGPVHMIEVVADKDSRYKSPDGGKPEITLKAGEQVLLRVSARKAKSWNRDGSIHGFTLLRAGDRSKVEGWNLLLRPGQQEFQLTAPAEPGEYVVVCTVICSEDHEGMNMRIAGRALIFEELSMRKALVLDGKLVADCGLCWRMPAISNRKPFAARSATPSVRLNVHSLTRSHSEMLKSKKMGGSAGDCATYCVRYLGGDFVLSSKNEVYRLDNQEKVRLFAGQKVKITGTLESKSKTIHVLDIEAFAVEAALGQFSLHFLPNASLSLFLRFGNHIDDQNSQLRLNGMAISRMRENGVVHRRVEQDQPEKQPGSGPAPAQGESQAPESQHRRSQENRVFYRSQRRDLRQPRNSAPVIDEALQAEAQEARVVLANECNRLALSLRHVGNFAHLAKAAHLINILGGMKIFSPCSIGSRTVSDAQLGAEVRAQRHHSQSPVIPRQPGRDAGNKYHRRQRNSSQRRFAALPAPVPRPQSGSGQECQQGSVGQRRDSPEQPEPNPRTSPSLSSRSSVSQKTSASSNAARLVSHTQRVHQYITGGITAQSQAVQTASFFVETSLGDQKNRNTSQRGKKLLMPSSTSAEAWV